MRQPAFRKSNARGKRFKAYALANFGEQRIGDSANSWVHGVGRTIVRGQMLCDSRRGSAKVRAFPTTGPAKLQLAPNFAAFRRGEIQKTGAGKSGSKLKAREGQRIEEEAYSQSRGSHPMRLARRDDPSGRQLLGRGARGAHADSPPVADCKLNGEVRVKIGRSAAAG
jgi:hypothetical protein